GTSKTLPATSVRPRRAVPGSKAEAVSCVLYMLGSMVVGPGVGGCGIFVRIGVVSGFCFGWGWWFCVVHYVVHCVVRVSTLVGMDELVPVSSYEQVEESLRPFL